MIAAAALVVGWFWLMWAFIVAMHANDLRDRGVQLSVFWRANMTAGLIVGVLLDFTFNVVAGTLMFVELPHEWMFTSRCKRHVGDERWRGRIARWWQRQLNQIRAGHV